MVYTSTDNNYGTAKLIVGTTGKANYLTIATALTAASSGDTIFILPGTYTENLTLKAGVNLTAYNCDALTPNVTITGKCTATFAGTCSLSGIKLKTNADFLLVASGANATIVNLTNCFLDMGSTGISFTVSNTSAEINLYFCRGNISTTGVAIFASTSTGVITQYYTDITNSGSSITASTLSAGQYAIRWSRIFNAITTSSTAIFTATYSDFNDLALNLTMFTSAGTGSNTIRHCQFTSGTASCLSLGSGTTTQVYQCTLNSSNTNAVTGAGTLQYGELTFSSSSVMNTTTQTAVYTDHGKYKASGQPAFLVYSAANINNVTGNGTVYTIAFDTEVFDRDNNYASNTFTAPVTGRYSLGGAVNIIGCTICTGGQFYITTSNREYRTQTGRAAGNSDIGFQLSALADMDAADTAVTKVFTTGEAGATNDVQGGGSQVYSYFSGYLAT